MFLFIPIICFTQTKTFPVVAVYKLDFAQDSTNTDVRSFDEFKLLIEEGKSYFVSSTYLKKDSIIKEIAQTFNLANAPKLRFRYVINKSHQKIDFYDEIINNKFHYEEPINFSWKITGESSVIANYNCIKAETTYGGRIWYVWFAPDIPINDGPYKFSNLPGLILKAIDSKSHYNFELVELRKNVSISSKILNPSRSKSFKTLDKAKYVKAARNINGNMINELARNGITVSAKSTNTVRANIKKKNNPIEID